jgi:hypothetical protein
VRTEYLIPSLWNAPQYSPELLLAAEPAPLLMWPQWVRNVNLDLHLHRTSPSCVNQNSQRDGSSGDVARLLKTLRTGHDSPILVLLLVLLLVLVLVLVLVLGLAPRAWARSLLPAAVTAQVLATVSPALTIAERPVAAQLHHRTTRCRTRRNRPQPLLQTAAVRADADENIVVNALIVKEGCGAAVEPLFAACTRHGTQLSQCAPTGTSRHLVYVRTWRCCVLTPFDTPAPRITMSSSAEVSESECTPPWSRDGMKGAVLRADGTSAGAIAGTVGLS